MTAGYGEGELENSVGSNDLSMQTFAIGGGGVVWQRAANTLRLKGEFAQSSLEVDDGGISNLPEEVDVSRARVSAEFTNSTARDNGAHIERNIELGVRHDGGDGVTGSGIELGLGLRHINASGLSVEGKIRALLGHSDINEWGVSGTIKKTAGADGQGWSFALSPGYGDDAGDLQLWDKLPDATGNAAGNADDAVDRDYGVRPCTLCRLGE